MIPKRRFGIDDDYVERPDGNVFIQHGVIPNEDQRRGGWMPAIWVDGRRHSDAWGKGYDRDSALQLAYEGALEEAGRYLGGYSVTIEPRDNSPKPRHAAHTRRPG